LSLELFEYYPGKQDARQNIRQLYDTDSRIHNDQDGKYTVRINAPTTNLALDDINAIFNLNTELIRKHKPEFIQNLVPKSIFVPKTNTTDDIKWLYEKLNSKNYFNTLNLFFYMESATSLINLNDIIKVAIDLSVNKYNNRFNLEGFVFGSG
jgi:citrate lyase beta subunit